MSLLRRWEKIVDTFVKMNYLTSLNVAGNPPPRLLPGSGLAPPIMSWSKGGSSGQSETHIPPLALIATGYDPYIPNRAWLGGAYSVLNSISFHMGDKTHYVNNKSREAQRSEFCVVYRQLVRG